MRTRIKDEVLRANDYSSPRFAEHDLVAGLETHAAGACGNGQRSSIADDVRPLRAAIITNPIMA